MDLINNVFDLAGEFMENPQYVDIIDDNVYALAEHMVTTGITPFPSQSTGENCRTILMKELVASSINYCYWYGKSDIRPGGCSSGLMYDLVNQTFKDYGEHGEITCFDALPPITLKYCIHNLKRELSLNRFPLLEERIKHLTEVANAGEIFITHLERGYINNQLKPEESGYKYFKMLVELFPGFASDLFLKRASLFFLQLYRKLGWYSEMMKTIHVPADYQVPKLLRHFKCFKYVQQLDETISGNHLLPKSHLAECEVRAATIVTCQMIQKATEWNISDIDSWLWLRRKECNDPFHTTITTDY
jgi:hypothetical protein